MRFVFDHARLPELEVTTTEDPLADVEQHVAEKLQVPGPHLWAELCACTATCVEVLVTRRGRLLTRAWPT